MTRREQARSIARGLGTTFTSPSDEAVRLVFEEFLALDDMQVIHNESYRQQNERIRELERQSFDANGSPVEEDDESRRPA